MGETVQLDPSGAFSLTWAGSFTYTWSLTARPDGSLAALDDTTALRPTMTVDVPGDYLAELAIAHASDGFVLHTVKVAISTENTAPVAQIGLTGGGAVGADLTLDGSPSFDVDGDSLGYAWQVTDRPNGSTAALTTSTGALTRFAPDADGRYEFSLVVTDSQGVASPTAYVEYDTAGGGWPVASDGWEQVRAVTGEPVHLDSFASTDMDGSALAATWRILRAPDGSTAAVALRPDGRAALTPDLPGDYLVQLEVTDGGVTVHNVTLVVADPAANVRPAARIERPASVATGAAAALDASQSFDLDGDQLGYAWSLVSRPANSTASLSAASGARIALTPDLAGDYVVQLVVNDGSADSVPVTALLSTDSPLPVAEAGPDAEPDSYGVAPVDGTGSYSGDGSALDYHWSILGLVPDPGGSVTALLDGTGPQREVMIAQHVDVMNQAVLDAIVYQNWGDSGFGRFDQQGTGLCRFDVRSAPPQPASLDPDNPVHPSLKADGLVTGADGVAREVWKILNDKGVDHQIRLEATDGSWAQDFLLAGGVNAFVAAPYASAVSARLLVDGALAEEVAPATSSFSRNDPVCIGAASTVAQLVVTGAGGASYPDTVMVGADNIRPVVLPGPDLETHVGQTLSFTGDDHGFDADGDPLSYHWSIVSRPPGSTATLDGLADTPVLTADGVTLVADRLGFYHVQVFADDGDLMSEPAVIVVEAVNTPPVADAGPDADVFVGDLAQLDGSGSFDADGDSLAFHWTFVSRPDGSAAVLNDMFAVNPSFTPDRRGDYVIRLTVSDPFESSPPDDVVITAPNRAPVAAIAPLEEVPVGTTVTLDGSASSDPDNDPLTYQWSIVDVPDDVDTTIAGADQPVASYVPEVAGAYTIQLTVDDGLATNVAQAVLEVRDPNLAPRVEALPEQLFVEAGKTLEFTVEASDVDEDQITFFALPLPLPANMTFNATTGFVSFSPDDSQVGDHFVHFGATDGVLTHSVATTITVRPRDAASETTLAGLVLDGEDFANGVETPLANIPVRLRDGTATAVTGADGRFVLTGLEPGRDLVIVEPDGGPNGYTRLSREVEVVDMAANDVAEPFLLGRVTGDCATVVAGASTVIDSATLGVSVTIPADSVKTETGAAYAGQVCLGALPERQNHPAMPEGVNACQIYTISAPGAVFNSAIDISAPNRDLLPETARTLLWHMAESTGRFLHSGYGTVEAGGQSVTTALTARSESPLFALTPMLPKTAAAEDQPTGRSRSSVLTGDFTYTHALPAYRSLNEEKAVGIEYHSAAADPQPIIAANVTISSESGLPLRVDSDVVLGGLVFADPVSFDPRNRADGSQPALVGEEVTLRHAVPLDASGLPTGRYAYDYTAKAQYECSTVASTVHGEIHVANDSTSPIGTGWQVAGLQRLIEQPGGGVTIVEAGETVPFDPQPTFTSFSENLSFPTLGGIDLTVADFDGNGHLDIAHGVAGRGSIGFIWNFGERDFRQDQEEVVANAVTVPQTASYSPDITAVAHGEFNSTPVPELVYTTQHTDRLGGLVNNGFRSFRNVNLPVPPIFAFDRGYVDIDVNDFDGDGDEDFAFAANAAFFFIRSQHLFVSTIENGAVDTDQVFNQSVNSFVYQLESGDLDGDGLNDIVMRTQHGARIFWNNGNKNFSVNASNFGTNNRNFLGDFMQVEDLNGDGLDDLAWSSANDIQIYFATGSRQMAPATVIGVPGNVFPGGLLNVFDANDDGHADVVMSTGFREAPGAAVLVYQNDGEGNFAPPEIGNLDHGVGDAWVADMDGDGSQDLVTVNRFRVYIDFSAPENSGVLIAGSGEFSTLERLADGGWKRTYKDGTQVFFDADGLQVSEVDTNGNVTSYAYDSQKRLTTITDPAGLQTVFTYGAGGILASITDPSGRITYFAHNSQGHLVEITEPDEGLLAFQYDEQNRLIATRTQRGFTTQHNYGFAGRYLGSDFPDGSSVLTSVGALVGLDGLESGLGTPDQPLAYVAPEDRVTSVIDKRGNELTVVVNEFGLPVEVTDQLGRQTVMVRDENGLVTRLERPSDGEIGQQASLGFPFISAAHAQTGSVTRVDTFVYDANGNLLEWREAVGTPLERVTRFEYEPVFNRVTKIIDPDGGETTYEYDANGNPTRTVDAEGGERLMAYDLRGLKISETDPNGNATLFAYDTLGLPTTVETADGSVTEIAFDIQGNITLLDEAVGGVERRQRFWEYDVENRVKRETDGLGNQIDYTYDATGNLLTVTDATGLVTSFAYDELDRLLSVDDPVSGTTGFAYDIAGDLASETDAESRTYTYAYDAIGRLVNATDPDGTLRLIGYDVSDNVINVTDGRGGRTDYTHDILDRVISRTNPLGKVRRFAYDARDNLVKLTREDGAVETATYDALSRRLSIALPGDTLSYTYDANSNLLTAADGDSLVSFTYDAVNRVATTTTDGTAGPQPAATLSYTYDLLSRRTAMQDSLGGATAYEFDAADRLTAITPPWGGPIAMEYDPEGRRTRLLRAAGLETLAGFDTGGRLATLEHRQGTTPLLRRGFGYNAAGQLAEIRDLEDLTRSKSLTYDALSQLVMVAKGTPPSEGGTPVPVEDYAYDAEGNRAASHLSPTHEHDPQNRLVEDADYTYAYDDRGNRVTRTAKATGVVETYSYDSLNRLVGVTSTDGLSAAYHYDAFGRRIARDVTEGGVRRVTAYVYDGEDIALEYDVTDSVASGGTPALVRRWQHGAGIDEPLAFEQYGADVTPGAGTDYEVHSDRQGSVALVTEPGLAAISASYDYDAFGNREAAIEAIDQPYGYTGRELDAETGLYHYRARAYDPRTGKFLQDDPIGFAAGDLNLTAYVWNDPYNWRDPSGLTGTGYTGTSGAAAGAASGATRALHAGAVACLTGIIISGLDLLASAFEQQAAEIAAGSDEITFGVQLTTPSIAAAAGAGCVTQGHLAKLKLLSLGEKLRKRFTRRFCSVIKSYGHKPRGGHHIIQDAAARDLPNYSYYSAPTVDLPGINRVDSPHYAASRVQDQRGKWGGGTYNSERRLGYRALRAAGCTRAEAKAAVRAADEYFESIGVGLNTRMRVP